MDLLWLVIPAAVGLFALRTLLIARKLKQAAGNATEADRRALRDARESLRAHRGHLEEAMAAPRAHLAAAKQLRRSALAPPKPSGGLDAMVADYLPERRS